MSDIQISDRPLPSILRVTKPVDIDVLRQRQQGHLPILATMHAAAIKATSRDIHSLGSGHDLKLNVFYHYPDHPGLLNTFIHTVSDHPVVIPLTSTPAQAATAPTPATPSPIDRIAIFRNVPDLGAIMETAKIPTDEEFSFSEKYRVVYPRMLAFIMHWIENVEGPLHHVEATISTRPNASRRRPFNSIHLVTYGAGTA